MKTAAIISEYNPFHYGHKYMIDKVRKEGADHVMAVMSGNYTQRGDTAVFDKFSRAECALQNGVDLVVELPTRFALIPAEGFARGAVEIILALGCADMLAFGSESGDISALKEASGAIDYVTKTEEFAKEIKRGSSYPAALHKTLAQFYTKDVSEVIDSPNNTLAIEYLNALDNAGSGIEPFTVKRIGARHDSGEQDVYTSASSIRKMIHSGENYSKYAPLVNVPASDISKLEPAILAKLRSMRKDDFERIFDCAGGLGERLYKAVRHGGSLSEIYFLTKTKRYTLARIRRAVLCAFLDIDKSFALEPSRYVRILGMNSKGKEILSAVKCSLPVDTSLKALSKTSKEAARQAIFEARCTDIYQLAFEKPRPCGTDYTTKPIIIDD